jgi:hypothetical protein
VLSGMVNLSDTANEGGQSGVAGKPSISSEAIANNPRAPGPFTGEGAQ